MVGLRFPMLALAASASLAALGGIGCTASDADVQPPDDQFGFPTGLAITPDDSLMFVANANAELAFDSGSLLPIDLAIVDQVANDWQGSQVVPAACNIDPDHTESIICDEAQFIRGSDAVRIGNFNTDIAVQDTGSGTYRLILPTRGDPSITWVDWNGTTLDCGDNNEGFPLCDDDHRLTTIQNDPNIGLISQEPFNAYVDSVGQFAIVTHLSTGDITLVDTRPGSDAEIADVLYSVFEPNSTTGLVGSTGVAGRTQSATGDIVYVGSPSENRVQTVTVGRPVNDALPFLIEGDYFFLDSVGQYAGLSDDTRGMKFSPDGSQLFLVNRSPPSLQVFDTAVGSDGFPANQLQTANELCREASEVTLMDSGDGLRAYVTCFADGTIYVVDAVGQAHVDAIEPVGLGPYAIAAAPSRKKVYVTNFLEDTVSVIDAVPGSPTRNHVILRLGQPLPPVTVTQP